LPNEEYKSTNKQTNKQMYVVETKANQIAAVRAPIVFILCYQICGDCEYPFLQFMMQRIPPQSGFQEQLTLPWVEFELTEDENTGITQDVVRTQVLHRVKAALDVLQCDSKMVRRSMYKGIVEARGQTYAMVNLGPIRVYPLFLQRHSEFWVVLSSEIMNPGSVCNIAMDSEVVHLFHSIPELGTLLDETHHYFPVPDAVYYGSVSEAEAKISAVLGCDRQNLHSGPCYSFYRAFGDAVHKEGILYPAINRYALFSEGLPLYGCNAEATEDYNLFMPLSYHLLDAEPNEVFSPALKYRYSIR